MPKLLTMHVDLFDHRGNAAPDTAPHRAWQVIEAARRRYLTGLLVLETTPPTHVYLRDGQVYFAERTTDGGLAVRLLVEGVITRAQMQKATLQVSGVEHLGRMFDRDDSIDRDAVELCVELMTDDVLTHIAEAEVTGWDMKMYQRHPSGLDRWLPTRVEVITHLVESPAAADPEVVPTPAPAPRPRPQLAPPPITGQVPVASTEPPTADQPLTAAEPIAEPRDVAGLIAEADLVAASRPTGEAPAVPDAPAFTVFTPTPPSIPVTLAPDDPTPLAMPQPDATNEPRSDEQVLPTQSEADEIAPIEEQALADLGPSTMESLTSSSIKDEVAEAVRRALAGIDH